MKSPAPDGCIRSHTPSSRQHSFFHPPCVFHVPFIPSLIIFTSSPATPLEASAKQKGAREVAGGRLPVNLATGAEDATGITEFN